MTRLSPRIYADLIGKPYKPSARGPENFDCLGLTLELLRRQGYAVPGYDSSMEEFHRSCDLGTGVLGICREIARPVPGCVVLFRTGTDERHLGVMIDAWTFLHTQREVRSACLEKTIWPAWRNRVVGFYLPAGGAA